MFRAGKLRYSASGGFWTSFWTSVAAEKEKASPHSIARLRVPELIPVLGSQPAGDVSHKPGGRLPLLSASHPRNT